MSLTSLTLERVLTGAGFADVPASPLQRAICRAASGLPIGDIDRELVERHFGCADLPTIKPRRVVLIAGIRGGKSLLSCCAAIHACLTADLSSLKPHELPRYAVIAPTVDAARATFVQLTGIVQSSPTLRTFLDGEPTTDTLVIRRPDGRRVEIVVVAALRGGLSVRNRWLVGACLEECASFGSESSGAAVNAEDILAAAETRLLPGCQAWLISSPFGPVGILYELHARHFGRSGGTTLVVHAPTRALNPSFPQSRIDEIRLESPDVAAREYDASWVDADSAFLPAVCIDAAIRESPMVRPGTAFHAAMDPATRGNSWTLAVGWTVTSSDGLETRVVIAGCWQWTGSKSAPLSPRATLAEIATVLAPFGAQRIHVDGWSFDSLREHASAVGLTLEQHTGGADQAYARLRTLLANGLIELPPHPIMRQDLLSIRQRATASGVKIHLPKTADGRHCDFAPSIALASFYADTQREWWG
ncbi:MAG: hypothetical protein JWN04_3015, partial [Myxococcaceae bacterium]|nr:hypothetical protein [Myxococcaceae bacterium]